MLLLAPYAAFQGSSRLTFSHSTPKTEALWSESRIKDLGKHRWALRVAAAGTFDGVNKKAIRL